MMYIILFFTRLHIAYEYSTFWKPLAETLLFAIPDDKNKRTMLAGKYWSNIITDKELPTFPEEPHF